MSSVTLKNISKSFGRVEAVRDISLEIPHGEFVVFVGPSGCGKSTLLRMIAGLEDITGGRLDIADRPVNDVPAADRGIAMVFQSYALYPHMNVRENIGFGLKMAGMSAPDVARKVDEAAASLQIAELLDRRPRELSGGQRQRVAIGRAIVKEPDVFLFDEPLSNLDADLRAQMRMEIARLHKTLNSTVIYVTHDQVEAMTLADRIVVLRDGSIEQIGTPDELYENPANVFVAQFLGLPKMNLLSGRATAGGTGGALVLSPDCTMTLPQGFNLSPGEETTIGIRPGDVKLVQPAAPEAVLAGEVDLVEYLGDELLAYIRVPGINEPILAKLAQGTQVVSGQKTGITFDQARAHVFTAKGERAPKATSPE